MKKFLRLLTLSFLFGALSTGVEAAPNVATFAGGCFWCMQAPFEQLQGVNKVEAGYTGGTGAHPSYQDYAEKGYTEAVQLTYDPAKISYEQLLDVFWRQINPTDPEGQFVDRGPQYRAAIFAHNDQQKKIAEASREALNTSGRFDKEIVIKILPYSGFVAAEDYHQDFYKKNPDHYRQYRSAAGRDDFLERIWAKSLEKKAAATLVPTATFTSARKHKAKKKKTDLSSVQPERSYKLPTKDEIKKQLSALQCHVTQDDGTEPPFENAFWNNEKPGIYVDVVSGEPLFSSTDKFDSGTGWPSFSKPLVSGNIVEKKDNAMGLARTEVRSKHANSHLGHVFNDGPATAGGLRYCMNSASLRFIPAADLKKEGYEEYGKLFVKP